MQYHQFIIDNDIVLDGRNLNFLKDQVQTINKLEDDSDSLKYFTEDPDGMSLIEWNLIFELKTKSV